MPEKKGRRRAVVVPTFIFIVVLLGLFLTWWAMDRQWRANVQGQLNLSATQASHRLRQFVDSRLMAIQSIADYNHEANQEFVINSWSLQQHFGGFQALNWVGVDGTIEVVVPRTSNSGALGKNLVGHPIAGGPFLEAKRSGLPQMTAPLELYQGGRGVAAYLPIVRNGKDIGYLNAVFGIQQLVEQSLGSGMLDSHSLSIVDGRSVLYNSPNLGLSLGRPSGVASVTILNRQWTLIARPDDKLWETMDAGRPLWIFVIALVLAAGACWLLRGALLRSWREANERRHRQELELELERSAKMQALGRLAGGVAHDFNNVLTAIIGNAEIIRLTATDSAAEQSAKDIVSASERASDLTRQLLLFSNQRLDSIVSIDLNSEIEELRGLLIRLVSEKIELSFDLDQSLEPVQSNRGQISQILVNLTVNAADAMPDGGRLSISTEMKKSDMTPSDEVTWVVLSVEDSGVGMDTDTQLRIFEPFYSTKGEAHNGAGLGLATVYGIVQALGGTLRVQSKLGVGTTFEVWLSSSTEMPTAIKQQDVESRTLAPVRRILFVEDDLSVRGAIVKALRRHGHTVCAATNGEEALELTDDESTPPFDIIITDAVMPGLSGPAMIRLLRERNHTLPIIICSGYSEELSDLSALKELDAQFLPKPYPIKDLLLLIEELTANTLSSSPSSASKTVSPALPASLQADTETETSDTEASDTEASDTEASDTEASDTEASDTERLRILIIDDEPTIRKVMKLMLAAHCVTTVANGREALPLLEWIDYDIIFCDLIMPDLTGMDVFEYLEKERPSLVAALVFMTGAAFTERARAFLEQCKQPILDKPFSNEKIEAILSERVAKNS